MAKEQFIDAVYEVLREDDNIDCRLEKYGYDDDLMFLILYSPSDAEKINNSLKEKLEDTMDKFDITQNHCNSYTYGWLDYVMGDMWGYDDEYYVCDNCNKIYRYNESSYSNCSQYWIANGCICCSDCVKSEYKNDYIEERINNYKNANTILNQQELEAMGYVKVNKEEYRNGMYGQNDSPKEIMNNYLKRHPHSKIIFNITDRYNPYEVSFDMYKRERKGD